MFKSKSKDGSDYHGEMNGNTFMHWTETKLLPALSPNYVVVMDNAPYHSVKDPSSVSPTTATRKGDMLAWLNKKKIKHDNQTKVKSSRLTKLQ